MNDTSNLCNTALLVEHELQCLSDPAKRVQVATRLRELSGLLGKCWDLLLKRRPKREFRSATVRDPTTIEGYSG